jgi:hypothetical protein
MAMLTAVTETVRAFITLLISGKPADCTLGSCNPFGRESPKKPCMVEFARSAKNQRIWMADTQIIE